MPKDMSKDQGWLVFVCIMMLFFVSITFMFMYVSYERSTEYNERMEARESREAGMRIGVMHVVQNETHITITAECYNAPNTTIDIYDGDNANLSGTPMPTCS